LSELVHPKTQIVGYVRVSTDEQNPERQLNGYPCDKVFVEYASGKNMERPQLQSMMDYMREGDLLVVHSMDRLARKLDDLLYIVRYLNRNKVAVKFLKENLTLDGDQNAMTELILGIFAAVAQFERAWHLERQKEGIKAAKARGVYKGSKKKLTDEQIQTLKVKLQLGVPKARIARELKVTVPTIYNYLHLLGD